MKKWDADSKWALQFLDWFCPAAFYEGIAGDLLEKFEEDRLKAGDAYAAKRLRWGVIKFFRPSIIFRNNFSFTLINTTMLSNYLTIAWRNVLKNKIFSAINIFGLGIGLAACLLIFQFVTFELSYDKFNGKFDRTYRVTNDRFQNGKLIQHGTITYPTIGPTMARDFPEVEQYTRLLPNGELLVKVDERIFRIKNTHYADEHFLSVFNFPLLAGDSSSALKDPYSMVLTRQLADRYFKIENDNYAAVLGKVIYEGVDPQPFKIAGVCDDIPENSHFQFDALISYATSIKREPETDDSWTWSDMRHYLVLRPGTDYKSLEAKFPGFSERYFKGDKVSGSIEKFYLQPLRDVHLYSKYEYDIAKTANGRAVWAMLIVAVFILVIAWINYINLTTSRALDRAKEVGLRKVMGAAKGQLVRQFIFESVLISALAFFVALVVTVVLQGPFNEVIGGRPSILSILLTLDSSSIAILVFTMAAGILLSGFYPAFVLSGYQPVTVLKGKFQRSDQGQFLRKALVVFQFTSSTALIAGTLIVSKQLKFMNEADLGINISRTMIVQAPERTAWDSTFKQRVESYEYGLTQINEVMHATTSWRLPGDRLGRTFGVRLAEQPEDSKYTLSVQGIDHNFFKTYGISVITGRDFSPNDYHANFESNNKVIINSSAVKLLGIENAEQAVGRELIWGNNGTRKVTVIGVVNDFHQESLKNPMEAMIFRMSYSQFSETSIKIKGDSSKRVIAAVEATFNKFFPDNAFEYFFLDQRFNNQYDDDNRFGKIISIFTVLAIMISALGLIGLSSYTASQRTKEIGIRKVLGASLFSIVSLLSYDFIKLVLLAAALSLPIAYFAMDNWLTTYAYRISMGWLLFIVPIILILLIAVLTMSFQVIKTAMTNPAKTLKYE